MPGDAKPGGSLTDQMRTRFGPRFLETARARVRRSLELLGKPTETEKLVTELHSLAGEAAMLGLQSLSDTARKGEEQAKEWQKGSTTAALYCARSVRALSQQVEEFAASIDASVAAPLANADPGPSAEAAAGKPSPDTAAATDEAPRKVLIIDDSRLAGDHLCDALGSAGLDPRLATAREDALAELTQLGELCVALRSKAPRPVYIMLISGMSEPELARRAEEVEADGYVSKHVGIERVVEQVLAALQELAK